MLGVVLVLSGLAAGCAGYAHQPTYKGSAFKRIVAAETRPVKPGARLTEKDTQAEVDRLRALRPSRPVPKRVLLYEVPSTGMTNISSARKQLLLHKETAEAMKSALEETGLFDEIDFLPDIYLPADMDLKTLRIAAARAQADALLIYSTEAGYEYEPNALSLFYMTVVGAFFVPGSRGSALAVSQAVLLDVKTGYVYHVLESYGEHSEVTAVALIDEEDLEFEARRKALTDLAKVAAARAKKLGK